MRFSVTQLRLGILILNVGLTVLLAAQAALAVFTQPETTRPPQFPGAGTLKFGVGDGDRRGEEQTIRVAKLGERLVPPPPPAPITPGPESGSKGPEQLPVEGELPPGPLNDEWEFVFAIIVPGDPSFNVASLAKKDPAAAAGGAVKKAGARVPRVIRSPAPGRTVRPQVPGAPAAPADKKSLQNRSHWKDDDLKIDVWVEDITLKEFVYSDSSQPGRLFALPRKTSDIYDKPKGDTLASGPARLKTVKEEDPQNPDAKTENEKHFFIDPPDREKEFENRKNAKSTPAAPGGALGPGKTPPRPTSPNAAHAANADKRPKSTEEQLKELGKLSGEIEKSEKFKKMPRAQQEQFRAALKPGGKK
jgi:hypothetical protein